MQLIDWQTVQHISRLSILNRVAFTMLFLVPLFAGFLKPVRVSVEKANNLIEKAKDETAEIRDIAEGAEALVSMASKLNTSDDDSTTEEKPALGGTDSLLWAFDWSLDNPKLPRPWAMAFAAALMLLTADTLYQIFCPAMVKQASLRGASRINNALSSRCILRNTSWQRRRHTQSKTKSRKVYLSKNRH